MNIILFKGNECAPCQTMETFLKAEGIEYTPVIAADDPKQASLYKVRTVPTLVVLEGEEVKHKIVGLKFSELKQILAQ